MAKSKLQEFRVAKVVRVWVEASVRAETFEQAVEQGKSMNFDDFVVAVEGAEVIDHNTTFYGVTKSAALEKFDA